MFHLSIHTSKPHVVSVYMTPNHHMMSLYPTLQASLVLSVCLTPQSSHVASLYPLPQAPYAASLNPTPQASRVASLYPAPFSISPHVTSHNLTPQDPTLHLSIRCLEHLMLYLFTRHTGIYCFMHLANNLTAPAPARTVNQK
jgi:hypothetical protein